MCIPIHYSDRTVVSEGEDGRVCWSEMGDQQVLFIITTLRLKQNGDKERLAREEYLVPRHLLQSDNEGRQIILQIFRNTSLPVNVDFILQRLRFYASMSASQRLTYLYFYVVYDQDLTGERLTFCFRETVPVGLWKHSHVIRMQAAKWRRLRKVEAAGQSSCEVCSRKFSCEGDGGDDNNAYALPCSHLYHQHCIGRWLERNNSCPTCRRPVLETIASCITDFLRNLWS